MKKQLLLMALLLSATIYAQTPRLINYQGSLRDAASVPLANKNFTIRFELQQGSLTNAVFTETQTLATSELGLFSTQIGKVNTAGMATLNVSAGNLFLVVGVDTLAGNNFVTLGERQQLVSVPYSLYALNVPSSFSNNVLSIGDQTYHIATSTASLQASGSGVASVTSSAMSFTVDVPASAISCSGNTVTLTQGTLSSSAAVGVIQPTLTVTGNTITLLQGQNPASAQIPQPTLTLSGPNNNSLSAGTNTVALNTYTAGNGLSMISSGSDHTISAISTSFQAQGIASVSPQSGTLVTVSVPGPVLTLNNNLLTVAQGTASSAVTLVPPALTLTGTMNNSLTAGTNTVVLNTYTAGTGLALSGSAPNQTLSANTTGTNAIWSTLGNTGTSTLNFIGTADNVRLSFRVNNQPSGRIDPVGPTFFGYQAGLTNTVTSNTGFGSTALAANTTGQQNTGIGNAALSANQNGSGNTAVGYNALRANTSGAENVAVGSHALASNTTGISNVAVGALALSLNTTGQSNVAIGRAALPANTGGDLNVAIGPQAMYLNQTGSANTAVGGNVLQNCNSGTGNSVLGSSALYNLTSGNNNSAFGISSLNNLTTGSENSAFGLLANVITGTLTQATAIGAHAKVGLSYAMVLGDTSNIKVGIGTGYPTQRLHVRGQIRIVDGSQGAGKVLTSDATGNASWQTATANTTGTNAVWGTLGNTGTSTLTNFIGTIDNVPLNFRVGNQPSGRVDLNSNVFLGYRSGLTTFTSSGNTGIGGWALESNTSGYRNTAVGANSLRYNTSAYGNSAFGADALASNTVGINNSAFGDAALFMNRGDHNTAVGGSALTSNTTGQNNTALGFYALRFITTGNNNTALGFDAGVMTGTLSNVTAIGFNAKVLKSNSMVLGDTNSVNVGIGTGAPTKKLDVRGQVRIVDGTQGSGKVLTSDANGNGSWQSPGTSSTAICILKDTKSAGTHGGSINSGSWITRDLNTVEGNTAMVSLASNQFTLASGTYLIRAEIPAYRTNSHKAKLRNLTDGSDAVVGQSSSSDASGSSVTQSIISGIITITSQKVFSIQQYCETTSSSIGLGLATYSGTSGAAEIYTQVFIQKLN